jgi:threonine synthase
MDKFLGYRCSVCKSEYLPEQVSYTCPTDGGNLDVILDYQTLKKKFNPDDITSRKEYSLWRYLPLLPLENPGGEDTPFRNVGWTPVYHLPALAKQPGLNRIFLKDESKNPTASFKDRASAIVVARARQLVGVNGNQKIIITASTGNAGAALAGMAAAIGQKAVIFAPKTAPPAKIAQLLIFGANVLLVDGTYDQAFDLSIKAAEYFGWYCRNTGFNPFTLEGKKTAAFEIWEWYESLKQRQKGSLHGTLTVVVSVGDGNIRDLKTYKHSVGWRRSPGSLASKLKGLRQSTMHSILGPKPSSLFLPKPSQIASR